MKNYSKVLILLCGFYVLGIAAVFLFMSSRTGDRTGSVIQLNDIVKSAEENWDDLEKLREKDFGTAYVILSGKNEILYESGKNTAASGSQAESLSAETAVKKGYPYAYITRDDRILGLVILPDQGNDVYRRNMHRMLAGFAVTGLLILLGAVLFGLYVKKNIILPFQRMEGFAEKVAQGKLDEPLTYEKGNLFGAFNESFDIMREELAKSRKRELALQKKERELVASLSHDLKTPVTGIKVTTELLKAKAGMTDSGQNTDFIEKLDHIEKKADQIDALVSDLFSATLDDLGEFKVACKDEDAKVLHELVEKNDDRELATEGSIPEVVINIDSRRMSQVIANIIANSYKYAGTKIDVEYRIAEDHLEMKLRDYGPGVAADELDLITNKFYRGKAWADSKEECSGLGLYIAKTLMEKMGGKLIPESHPDGFLVRLMIPLS